MGKASMTDTEPPKALSTLSQKSATVAVFSPFSVTVSFCATVSLDPKSCFLDFGVSFFTRGLIPDK